jgi:hypothetical protein
MQTDKEALKEFSRGVVFMIGMVAGPLLILAVLLGRAENAPVTKFEVVDKYGKCEVVRYTDETNHWNYFLDCPIP